MKKFLMFAVFSIVLAGCTPAEKKVPETPEGNLAQCLDEKGAVMYGTSWCPHCRDQKDAFGKESSYFLPFVDCDKKTGLCSKEKITGYPTWKFTDGTSLSGNRPLEELAKKTECEYVK